MRFPFRPFDDVPHVDFMRWRQFWVWSSAILVLATFVFLGVRGLNYGIDFAGGKLVEIQTGKAEDVGTVRDAVREAGFEGATIQQYGAANDFIIRLPLTDAKAQTSAAEASVVEALKAKVGQAELRRVEYVGPQVGQELRIKGLQAMLFSIVAILIYIWFRFEMRYGLGAILALIHDVVLTLGVMSLVQTEITLTVLAAILTLIGYSLNDTIVIFDRIRENRGRYPNRPLPEVLNLSVNQTLGRTVMTVSTVMIVLVALFFWGGEVIRDFAFVLIVGTVLGTYSSVFVASPVLLALEEWYRKMAEEDAKNEIKS